MYENKQGGRQKQRMLGLTLAVFAVLVLFSELGRTTPGTVEIVPGEALAGSEIDVVMENLLKFEEVQKRQRLARNAAMFALSGVMAVAGLLTSAQEEKKEANPWWVGFLHGGAAVSLFGALFALLFAVGTEGQDAASVQRVCTLLVPVLGAAAAACFFAARCGGRKHEKAVPPPAVPSDEERSRKRKKEEELRRLYEAGLIDRDEYNARRNALRKEEKDERDPIS